MTDSFIFSLSVLQNCLIIIMPIEPWFMLMFPIANIPARPLEPKLFAPYGQVISPRGAGGQFDINPYDPETSAEEANLTLNNGIPRLWIMRLKKNGLGFCKMARHRRVTQCLGSLHGKEWFIAVAPPNEIGDDGGPVGIAAFRIPGDQFIKLHVATWHAGPHFVYDECLFFNLENLDTNKRDFEDYELSGQFRISP